MQQRSLFGAQSSTSTFRNVSAIYTGTRRILYINFPPKNAGTPSLLVHLTYHINTADLDQQNRLLQKVVSSRPFVFNELDDIFLPSSYTSHAQPLKVVDADYLTFSWNGVDILLRSASLERRLAFLKVTPVVLGTNEGEDDDVGRYASDEDALDEGVVWHVFWAIWSLNRRAGTLSAS